MFQQFIRAMSTKAATISSYNAADQRIQTQNVPPNMDTLTMLRPLIWPQPSVYTPATTDAPSTMYKPWLRPQWTTTPQFSAFYLPHLRLKNTILSSAIAPLLSASTIVATREHPRKVTLSVEQINQLLQNTTLLQQLYANGGLKITRLPQVNPTQYIQSFNVELLGYSTPLTLINQTNGTQIAKLGDIEIPITNIQHFLMPSTEDATIAMALSDTAAVDTLKLTDTVIVDEPIQLLTATIEEIIDEPAVLEEEDHLPTDGAIPAFDNEPVGEAAIDEPVLPEHVHEELEDVPPADLATDLAHLDIKIQDIKDPLIQKQVADVHQALQNLVTQEDDSEHLAKLISLTDELVTIDPGPESKIKAIEYQHVAAQVQNSHSPGWQALGIAMMLLGTTIAALSVACCLATGFAPGAIGVVGGLALLAAGMGLFASKSPRKVASAIEVEAEAVPTPIL